MNPLMSFMNGGGNYTPPMFNNFANLMQQFNQFRNNFKGDPKAQVNQLLSSGQMSQETFNQLSQMAQMMGFKK